VQQQLCARSCRRGTLSGAATAATPVPPGVDPNEDPETRQAARLIVAEFGDRVGHVLDWQVRDAMEHMELLAVQRWFLIRNAAG